jgi:lipoprotein-releasing system ATP-binding protein
MHLKCQHISKAYHDGGDSIYVLQDINFELAAGQSMAIVGSSGSGKSTLMHILGGLASPTSGSVNIGENNLADLSDDELARIRNQHIGFVYQFHHLLPEFTALENIAMPLLIRGVSRKDAMQEAQQWLDRIQLDNRGEHFPSQLSGGERQRIAIARAMITKPDLLLADEPTGNLDDATGQIIYELLLNLQRTHHTALVIVTHDMNLAKKLERQFVLHHGQLSLCP